MENFVHRPAPRAASQTMPRVLLRPRLKADMPEFNLQRSLPHAPALLPELPSSWTPFRTSLIDTVRVVVDIRHPALENHVIGNVHVRRNGFTYLVQAPFTGAKAQVLSRNHGDKLIMEFSVAKFLTGQNLVGTHDIGGACVQCIKTVCELMNLLPTKYEREAIKAGRFLLTRVDTVAHVDCATAERAQAFMIALRNLIVGKANDVSAYGTNTLYIGQHSRRRSFKIYLKHTELLRNPMSERTYRREQLMAKAVGLVRLELVLRREQLADYGLDSPVAWTSDTAQELLQPWVDRLLQVKGHVPNIALIESLTPALQQKVISWMRGDSLAFLRNVKPQTQRESRNRVLAVTGIDINNHMPPTQQRATMLRVRDMFRTGYGFRDHADRWSALCSAVAPIEPLPPIVLPQKKKCR